MDLKGGAIIFALAILLFASVLISLFIVLNTTYTKINLKHINYSKSILKLNESFKLGYYLNTAQYKGGMSDMNSKEIEINKKLWGSYFLISSKVKLDSNNYISKVGIIGSQLEKDYSLYIANNNSKVSVTGNTLIKGNCFLPEKGVGISYVEGKSYTKKQLVFGNVNTSKSSLPPINDFIIQDNENKLNGIFSSQTDSTINLNDIPSNQIENSFYNKTLVIYSNSSLTLDASWKLKGNIILYSPTNVVIQQGATLQDVIIYSKNILVNQNVSTSCQLVAEKTVYIDSNSQFNYPSTLMTIGDSSSINLIGNSTINGSILSLNKNPNSFNFISIEKNASVTGFIYSMNKTEVKGSVFGKIITRKLFHKSPSTEYSNTLIDATVDNSTIENFYSIPSLLKEKTPKIEVIKWLN